MPEMNGLEATGHIVKAVPQTQVLIFTKYVSEQLVCQALDLGARGYVLKSAPADNLIKAIGALSRREAYFCEVVAKIVLEAYRNRFSPDGPSGPARSLLSAREREILQLLAEGRSNREVGKMLNISAKTVRTHRANMMEKLNSHSITDLVRYAIRNNIIEL